MVRLPLLLVTLPNEALVGLALAPPQFGWLVTLNNSVRNCSRLFSVTGKFSRIPKSHSQNPGLRRMLRGWNRNNCELVHSRANVATRPAPAPGHAGPLHRPRS